MRLGLAAGVQGVIRWLQLLVVAAGTLALVQAAIVALSEPGARRRFAAELGAAPTSDPVERRMSAWRRRLRQRLWVNVVAVPCLILIVLILVGEYG